MNTIVRSADIKDKKKGCIAWELLFTRTVAHNPSQPKTSYNNK